MNKEERKARKKHGDELVDEWIADNKEVKEGYPNYKDEKESESKEWIHREQQGKVRGVQRLGFKPVVKKRSWW